MASRYVTGTGEALDLICLRHYGAQAGAVERVLAVNPHISAVAHRLPPGTALTLPDMVVQDTGGQPMRLWD